MLEGGCSTGFGWGDLPTSGVKVARGASEERGGVVLLPGGPACNWGVSQSLLLLCGASWECQASSGGVPCKEGCVCPCPGLPHSAGGAWRDPL